MLQKSEPKTLRPIPSTLMVTLLLFDDRFSYAQAFAISDDKFVAGAATKDIRKLAGRHTKLVDLKGLTVTPGLTDNHLHSAGGGPGVDFARAHSERCAESHWG